MNACMLDRMNFDEDLSDPEAGLYFLFIGN